MIYILFVLHHLSEYLNELSMVKFETLELHDVFLVLEMQLGL